MNCHRNMVGLNCVEDDCRLWDPEHNQCYDASVAQAKVQVARAFTLLADTQRKYLEIINPDGQDLEEIETPTEGA